MATTVRIVLTCVRAGTWHFWSETIFTTLAVCVTAFPWRTVGDRYTLVTNFVIDFGDVKQDVDDNDRSQKCDSKRQHFLLLVSSAQIS